MGNCVINVNVTGSHHNGKETDIDQLAHDFVDALKANGHSVTHATIGVGGEYDLTGPLQRFPLKENAPQLYADIQKSKEE